MGCGVIGVSAQHVCGCEEYVCDDIPSVIVPVLSVVCMLHICVWHDVVHVFVLV